MASSERKELCLIVRRREKYEKTQAEQRSAELLADFERQLATIYEFDSDATWKAAHDEADKIIEEAEARIAARCLELGIPKECRPGLSFGWHGRGQNAFKDRRAELRRVAESRVEAIEKAARTQIERRSIEMQERVMQDALTSEAARELLTQLPTIASLMPPLDATALIGLVQLRESWKDR
jgi:hypothetical protein